MQKLKPARVAVVGGGPAGLMAAEVARAAGAAVDVYEGKGSVGRKFLIAGKGGLNLTHSDPPHLFASRYKSRQTEVAYWVKSFDATALRTWARDLGVETFVGTSGRVFPTDLKAAPLLRAWVRRLREQGVLFHVNHYCVGMNANNILRFTTSNAEIEVQADAIVLALGGASWPQLGSDGRWASWLKASGADIAPLQPANCGFDIGWSEIFAQRFAGQPVKSVTVSTFDSIRTTEALQGEFVVTANGIEGSVIYALSAQLRDAINADGQTEIRLDLAPHRSLDELRRLLSQATKGRSLTEQLRRAAGIDGVKTGLLYETMQKTDMKDVEKLATHIKSLPLILKKPRQIAESISTAGGVRIEALNERLMLRALPGVFCAGEMLDWEAPTGGYLLAACFASGRIAGNGAVAWLRTDGGFIS